MSTYRVGDYVRALIDQETGEIVGFRTPADEDQILALSSVTQAAVISALGYTPENVNKKGLGNGYASLDGTGRVPASQLPLLGTFLGGWNATTNSPALAAGDGIAAGSYRVVTTAGTQNIGEGSTSFSVGNYVIYDGSTAWVRVALSTAGVASATTVDPIADFDATDVQAAIEELVDEKAEQVAPTFLDEIGGTTVMRITAAGNVGVGSSIPSGLYGKFGVLGTGAQSTYVQSLDAGGVIVQTIADTDVAGEIGTVSDHPLVIKTNDTAALTIDEDQIATFEQLVITEASSTTRAGLRLPQGAAPTSPVNGDVWTTADGLYARIAGATQPIGNFTAAGSGAVVRTQQDKSREWVSAADYPSLAAALAESDQVLIAADITVAANTTVPLGASLTVLAGATISINSGVTLTVYGEVNAPAVQIFAGAGTVDKLKLCKLEWFVGDYSGSDAVPPTTECRALIQKGFDSTDLQGNVTAGAGQWLIDGSTPITVSKYQSFQGASEDSTVFRWEDDKTNGFYVPPASVGATLRGFMFKPNVPGTIATEGWALDVQNSYTHTSDYFIEDAFNGVRHKSVVVCYNERFQIIGSRNLGRLVQSGLDIHSSKYIIQALYDYVTVTPVSGTLIVGENFLTNGGNSGTIIAGYGSNKYRMRFVGPAPTVGALMEGSTSGAFANIAELSIGHAQGALKFQDNCEAVTEDAADVLGGLFSFVADTAGTDPRSGAAYNRVNGVYFDSSYNGSIGVGMYGFQFNGTWFASSASVGAKGMQLLRCRRIVFIAPQFVNNADAGLFIDEDSTDVEIHAPEFEGNCTQAGSGDLVIDANASYIRVFGGKAGYQGANGITPPKSIVIGSGTGNHLKFIGIDIPDGSITNGATGADQTWVVTALPVRFPTAVSAPSHRSTSNPDTDWHCGAGFDTSTDIFLADNATYDVASGSGVIFMSNNGGAESGRVTCHSGGTTVENVFGTLFTNTATTAGKINIFFNGGTSKYRIENKTGGAVILCMTLLRVRASV